MRLHKKYFLLYKGYHLSHIIFKFKKKCDFANKFLML